jgi:AraC-like DNA-binding protein
MGKRHDLASESFVATSKSKARSLDATASESATVADNGIDTLSDVLRTVRLTGAMLFLVDASSPWVSEAPQASAFAPVVLPGAQHLVSYHIVVSGSCWAGLVGATPTRFEAGDILLIPHGDSYLLSSSPGMRAEYGVEEAVTFFRQMAMGEVPSVVTEDGGGSNKTQFICGFLGCDLRPFNPVLAALPKMIHIRRATQASDRLDHLIEFALGELQQRRSGGLCVLLRLAELMFVELLRHHLNSLATPETGWLAGLRDPMVSRALALLHTRVSHPWTLASLAKEAGVSRSALADHFSRVVGQPPMHYLTYWRMQLAASLLADHAAKVSSVASEVGYTSEAAFSRAFKKIAGMAPAKWRDSRVGST